MCNDAVILFSYKTTAIETHCDRATNKLTNVTTYRADIPARNSANIVLFSN